MIAPEVYLTPSGQLRWPDDSHCWPERLFGLAVEKKEEPTLAYWRSLARHFLSGLCHIPEGATKVEVPPPSQADLEALVMAAPPMRGGEYLEPEVLRSIWRTLEEWVQAQVGQSSLAEFLQQRAPRWQQVGRVFFHLAENKNSSERPFAFMATYTTGLTGEGELKHLPLGKSLEQYAGAKNRQALTRLLLPLQKAAEAVDWVRDLVDSAKVYQVLAWKPDQAYRLLRSVEALEQSGLSVLLPNWWKKRPRARVSVTLGKAQGASLGASALLQFDVRLALGEEQLSAREIEELLAQGDGLVQFKGQWVEVDRQRLQEALNHWKSVQKQATRGEISFAQGMRLLAGASADLKAEAFDEEERHWVHLQPDEEFRQLLHRLRHPEALPEIPLSRLQATLRPYQQTGVAWLHLLTQLGLGACLADDMGLGKTIQILALLLSQEAGPSLLIVPASLLGNWKREGERFAPDLKMLIAHPGESEKTVLERLAQDPVQTTAEVDLVVTTYALAVRQTWLGKVSWQHLILDEAQAIKNPATSQTRAVKKLTARSRIALTGTPVENRLGDLWSIFDFLNPGLLGSTATFQSFLKVLQARTENQFAPLRQLVAPYILRRKKTDKRVISDLPDKIEASSFCGLTRVQVKLYEKTVQGLAEALTQGQSEGMARRGLVLQTLLRLKQICNHPSQLSGDGLFEPADSGKFARLAELCQEIRDRQEKVLVFSQFREIVEPLQTFLASLFGAPGLVLHGQVAVKQRQHLVDRFQDEDGPPFFVLSLKAGGTGLNLTRASHVIHFDRWWNPAVENQATDRAFRIGQRRNVLVHKFITRGTLEERIDQLLTQKQQLAEEILEGESELKLTELSDEQILDLVRLDIHQALA